MRCPERQRARLGIRRQQIERSALKWRNGPEMPLVEAEQTSSFAALRENHNRAIGEAEAEVGVADVKVGDRPVIIAFQA
jgi:hypothetical protein